MIVVRYGWSNDLLRVTSGKARYRFREQAGHGTLYSNRPIFVGPVSLLNQEPLSAIISQAEGTKKKETDSDDYCYSRKSLCS